jgi:hypothetical protein
MQDFKSVIKIFGLSLILVLLMQLRISDDTLENHFEGWIQNSSVVHYLQRVAEGAVKLGAEGASVVTEYTHDRFNIPAHWKAIAASPKKRSTAYEDRHYRDENESDEE